MERQDDEQALAGIIRMLLSLGQLAERASRAFYPVRLLVLWLLRPAEAVAYGLLCDMAQTVNGPAIAPYENRDNSSTGAIGLAMRFRALAAALDQARNRAPRLAREIRRATALFAQHAAGAPRLARIILDILPARSTARPARLNRPNDTS